MKRLTLGMIIAVLALFQVMALFSISTMNMHGVMEPCTISSIFGTGCAGDMNGIEMLSHHILAALHTVPTAMHGDAAAEAFFALLVLFAFSGQQRRSFIQFLEDTSKPLGGVLRNREGLFFAYRRKLRWSVVQDDGYGLSICA